MTSRENMQAKVRAILERANHPNLEYLILIPFFVEF